MSISEVWKGNPDLQVPETDSELGEGSYGQVYKAVSLKDGREYAVKKISLSRTLFDLKMNPKEFDIRLEDKQLLDKIRDGEIVSSNVDIETRNQLNKLATRVFRKLLSEVRHMKDIRSPNVVRYFSHWVEGHDASNIMKEVPDFTNMLSALCSSSATFPDSWENDTFLYIQMELCDTTLEKWLKAKKDEGDFDTIRQIVRDGALLQITSGLRDIHHAGLVHRDLKTDNILVKKSNNKDGDVVKYMLELK
jgi:serine/threonine protein kinase